MKVNRLTLRNFRNIEEATFYPDARLNFLIGLNGQGKTTVIEALGYLSTLRSFRGAHIEEVIRWGQTSSEISCIVSKDDDNWKTELLVAFSNTDRKLKTAFINGKPYKSSTQYLSQRFGNVQLGFHSIVFNPSDHELVQGEPAIRRAYLNRVLSAEDIDYLKLLQKYQRVLEQRNALLKADYPVSSEILRGFSEPLVRHGSLIVLKRLEWLFRLSKQLNGIASKIAPSQQFLRAIYCSNWVPEIEYLSIHNTKLGTVHFAGQQGLPSLELLEQVFYKKLSVLEEAELRARSTLVGPHRDDWAFFLGDRFLKGHGSQGEVRSALLALKLSEIELFRQHTGHRPLLLLDDFSSELDQERRTFLLKFLLDTDLQVFVTTTGEVSGDGKRFEVSNGKLFEVSK